MADVVALDFVVGDGQVGPAVAVEVGGDAAGCGVCEEARAVVGGEAAPGAIPVEVGVDVALAAVVVGADEEVEEAVVVEVGHGHGVDGAGGEQSAAVFAQAVGPVPVDVGEGVVRAVLGGDVAADDEVEVAVAGEVGGAGAGAADDGERLTAVHAEAFGSAPENEAAVVGDLGDDQVQPAVVVEIGEVDPARLVVEFALVLQADALGVGGVEAEAVRGVGGSSVEDEEVGIVEAAEDQVQVAVAIDVGDAGAVRPVGGQDPGWISGKAVGPVVAADRSPDRGRRSFPTRWQGRCRRGRRR